MAGDVRGQDLNSWWQNRADYRQDVLQTVGQWRAAASSLSKAANGVTAPLQPAAPGETLESLARQADATLKSLQGMRNEFAGLSRERQQAQNEFATEQSAIMAESDRRAKAEQHEAVQRAHSAAVMRSKLMLFARKAGALVIFGMVLYVIAEF
jgi:hypothetical protein